MLPVPYLPPAERRQTSSGSRDRQITLLRPALERPDLVSSVLEGLDQIGTKTLLRPALEHYWPATEQCFGQYLICMCEAREADLVLCQDRLSLTLRPEGRFRVMRRRKNRPSVT